MPPVWPRTVGLPVPAMATSPPLPWLVCPPTTPSSFILSHTYSISFLEGHGQSTLNAAVRVTNNSSIVAERSCPETPPSRSKRRRRPSASSLNATQVGSSIQIAASAFAAAKPPTFVPPPAVQAPPVVVPAVVPNTTVQVVTTLQDVEFRNDTITGESRIIQIYKLDPDGSEKLVFSDVPEKLNELLERLRRGAYRNGRYRVYLTEINLADKTVIERRLLLEINKSGNKLGEPVHEPGPGDRPLDDGAASTPGPMTTAPPARPQQPPAKRAPPTMDTRCPSPGCRVPRCPRRPPAQTRPLDPRPGCHRPAPTSGFPPTTTMGTWSRPRDPLSAGRCGGRGVGRAGDAVSCREIGPAGWTRPSAARPGVPGAPTR